MEKTLFIKDGIIKHIEDGSVTSTNNIEYDTVQVVNHDFNIGDEFNVNLMYFFKIKEAYFSVRKYLSDLIPDFEETKIGILVVGYNVMLNEKLFYLFNYGNEYTIKVLCSNNEVSELYKYEENYQDSYYFAWSVSLETGEKIDSYRVVGEKIYKNDIHYLTRTTYSNLPQNVKTLLQNFEHKLNIVSYSIKPNGDIIVETRYDATL
jgi:hypothetical protein